MPDVTRVHVHLKVSDLAKSREFYRRFLGGHPVKEKPDYVKFLPPWGPLNLALSSGRPADGRPAADHLGIQLESRASVLRELARVKAAGVAVREEFDVDCCHANQDKFWVSDPDGVEWEVYVLNRDLEDAPRDLPLVRGTSCCAPSP